MRFIAIAFLFTILTGCGEGGHYNPGYVITHSVLDEPLDEPDDTKVILESP